MSTYLKCKLFELAVKAGYCTIHSSGETINIGINTILSEMAEQLNRSKYR